MPWTQDTPERRALPPMAGIPCYMHACMHVPPRMQPGALSAERHVTHRWAPAQARQPAAHGRIRIHQVVGVCCQRKANRCRGSAKQ